MINGIKQDIVMDDEIEKNNTLEDTMKLDEMIKIINGEHNE